MSLTLVIIIAGAIVSNWFINVFFLENYYIKSKERDLIDTYELLSDNIVADKSVNQEDRIEIVSVCESKSITTLIVDSSIKVRFYSGYSILNDSLVDRLKKILFYGEKVTGEIIRENEKYTLRSVYDPTNNQTYLEMFGILDSGDLFVMRTSVESIKGIVKVSNQFFAYVGGVVMAISVIVVLMLSLGLTRRIEKLADISNEVSKLNFNMKYRDSGNDEISMLGNNMNILSERLEVTISELKSANNELQKDIQEKTEIDEMRTEFLSNVSHELKTPISIIQGYAEGLKESVNDDSESRDFYCDVIMDEAKKMNKMVQKLLTLNQIEFGNHMVEMERFDLVMVIDQILNKTSMLFQEKNANIIFDNRKQIYVWADEFQIEEVIVNYISNAANHLANDNIIKITLEEKENVIRCSVFNTGKHLPDSEIEKIWDKFYKVDKARTREYGGSGIGLSIVKAIMTSMNKECGVRNIENGVEFWFEVEKCI